MPGKRKTENGDLKCLICGADTLHAHSGIDSCRACSVFYKRTIDRESELVCISGDGSCGTKGKIVSCRKCRLECFKEVFNRASAGEIACNVERRLDGETVEELTMAIPEFPHTEAQIDDGYSDSEGNALQMDIPEFIDHHVFYNEPPRNNTPILDKMKTAYQALSNSRKAGEMSSLHHMTINEQVMMDSAHLRPSKYSNMMPYSKEFFIAMDQFAKASFVDIREMSSKDRHSLIEGNFHLILSIDCAYRGQHYFPNDDTVMATYLTYVSEDTLRDFFDDCPPEVNKDAAFEAFRKNMKETTILAKKAMGKVNPSVDEFLLLFGFTLWNDYTCSLDTEMANLVTKNREEILRELKIVYSSKGCTNNTPRIGELLCLLTNQEGVVERTNEDVQMYRCMNLFNEAYEAKK